MKPILYLFLICQFIIIPDSWADKIFNEKNLEKIKKQNPLFYQHILAREKKMQVYYKNPYNSPEGLRGFKEALIIIHGFAGSPGDWGNLNRYSALAIRHKLDLHFYTWKTGYFNFSVPDIDTQATLFADYLKNIKYDKVYILSHSTGGIISRLAILRLIKDGYGKKVEKLALIGVPNFGIPVNIIPNIFTNHPQLKQLQFGGTLFFDINKAWYDCKNRLTTFNCSEFLPFTVSLGGAMNLDFDKESDVFIDGIVSVASAWLPDTTLYLFNVFHFLLPNISENRLLNSFVDKFLDSNCGFELVDNCPSKNMVTEKELSGVDLMFFFQYPKSWKNLKIAFGKELIKTTAPEIFGTGACCTAPNYKEDNGKRKITFVLNRKFQKNSDKSMEFQEPIYIMSENVKCELAPEEFNKFVWKQRSFSVIFEGNSENPCDFTLF